MADSIVIVSAARTPIGGLLGDFASLRPGNWAPWRSGRGRTRRRARRRRRRSAVRQLPDGRPGPGAGAPGAAQGRPARQRRRRHAEQDVRLGHARGDVRPRHAARRQRQRGGGRRHGEHDQRAAPDVRAQGREVRRHGDVRPHGARRPGRRLRTRQGDGRVRRAVRRQVRLHARGAGPVRDAARTRAARRPTKTAASTGRWRPSRWSARPATPWSSSTSSRSRPSSTRSRA